MKLKIIFFLAKDERNAYDCTQSPFTWRNLREYTHIDIEQTDVYSPSLGEYIEYQTKHVYTSSLTKYRTLNTTTV